MLINNVPLPYLLVGGSIMGLLSAYFAHKRDRNPYLWFAIGFFFGLMGVMALFFAPSRKKETQAGKQVLQPVLVGPTDKFWYYLDETHQQQGPFSLNALSSSWKEGKITPRSFVWNEELPDWKPLQDFIEFR